MVRFSSIIGLNRFELGHVLGTDQGRLVPETPGRAEELALVAAGGLGADREALQPHFAGQAGKPTEHGFDRAGLVRELILDAVGGGSSAILGIK